MNETKIVKLCLNNFKGITDLTINFEDQTTFGGRNATGKTTLFDAFTWLLFGKDSQDRKDFEIKPRKSDNTTTDRLEVEVMATLLINGSETVLKRTFREKWVKPRGESQDQFTGHETLYEVNSVPMSLGDYKKVIDDICPEALFKLITSPSAFGSLSWQDKRQVLTDMAGDVTLEGCAKGNKDFEALIERLNGKDFGQFRKEINARKKKIKDELEQIDPRISEVQRDMPDAVDLKAIDKQIQSVDAEIQAENDKIADLSKQYEAKSAYRIEQLKVVEAIEQEIRNLKAQSFSDKEAELADLRVAIAEANRKISGHKMAIDGLINEMRASEQLIQNYEAKVTESRLLYAKINDLVFEPDPDANTCPTCKRELEDAESKLEELRGNFNENKAKQLAGIVENANQIKAKIEDLKKTLLSKRGQISGLESEIAGITIPELPTVGEPGDIVGMAELENKLTLAKLAVKDVERPESDQSILIELRTKRDNLIAQKAKADDRTKKQARIDELLEEKKTKGHALADVEKEEFIAEKLAKEVSEQVQNKVNGLFSTVKFKMFKPLINGGEEPDCVALINGVPYEAANNAARINAGIDIINALCKFHDRTAPIWIDNAEGVNEFINTESQLILLKVTDDKALKLYK